MKNFENFSPNVPENGGEKEDLTKKALKIKDFKPGRARQLEKSIKDKSKTGLPLTIEEEEYLDALAAFKAITIGAQNKE